MTAPSFAAATSGDAIPADIADITVTTGAAVDTIGTSVGSTVTAASVPGAVWGAAAAAAFFFLLFARRRAAPTALTGTGAPGMGAPGMGAAGIGNTGVA